MISRTHWRDIVLAAVGVTLGACVRWALSGAGLGAGATLIANLAGCTVAGLAAARSAERWRPFWLTGVAGGLSTLSALGADVEQMLDDGRSLPASGYVAISIAGGLLAVRLVGVRR